MFHGEVRSNYFEAITEALLSISGYGLAAGTSITLLKGAYLQYFFAAQYFYNFNDLDLASIFVVSGYLLTYTGIVTTRMLSDVVFRAKGSSPELSGPKQTGVDNKQGQNTNIALVKPKTSHPQTQNIVITTAQLHTCSSCGYGYYLNNPISQQSISSVGATTSCPKCGNVENVKPSWQI